MFGPMVPAACFYDIPSIGPEPRVMDRDRVGKVGKCVSTGKSCCFVADLTAAAVKG